MVSGSEENFITRLLSKYKNIAATKKEVVDVLNIYRLSFCLEKFVFNNGQGKDLFTLYGTIPVVYKNNTYYIPISIVLMDTHPNNTPICFVKPTATMQIKVSMYVDFSGKIFLPYLHDWQPGSSDLLGLIQVMIVTFGEYPPVFSKSKGNATPYPKTNSFMPQPGGSIPSFNMPMPVGGPGYPPIGVPGHGMPTPAGPGYPSHSFLPDSPYSAVYMGQGGPGGGSQSTGTITEEHIKASLLSAVEDKLRRRIQEKVNQCLAEIETLNRTKQELEEGSSKIDVIISRSQREERELIKNISILKIKEDELDKSLEVLEKMDGVEIDESVVTTAPLYKQLLNAYAEEAATEDAIYYLGESLRKAVIDLDTFLKHIRQLSRKQFMLRAIMQKCRQKAGLAGLRNQV